MKFPSLRKKILDGQLTVGTWIQTGNATIAGIMDLFGYDWIGIDCEHSDIDLGRMASLIPEIRRSAPLVRVRENDTLAIRHALDNGAMGVIVPLVSTGDDARRAVSSAKYPPIGSRGFGFCRANDWGYDFKHYIDESNDHICVIAMIESREGVRNIDDILSVEGIDGIFVGPYDMSGSYGIPGQIAHPIIEDALDTLLKSCEAHHKAAGMHIVQVSDEIVKRQIDRGFRFIALGTDIVFVGDRARDALRAARPD